MVVVLTNSRTAGVAPFLSIWVAVSSSFAMESRRPVDDFKSTSVTDSFCLEAPRLMRSCMSENSSQLEPLVQTSSAESSGTKASAFHNEGAMMVTNDTVRGQVRFRSVECGNKF